MKPTLKDLRQSALFCGYESGEPYIANKPEKGVCYWPTPENIKCWNPPENAEQDRELLAAIHAAGYNTTTGKWGGSLDDQARFDCDPNDFLTLAASRLWEMKNG